MKKYLILTIVGAILLVSGLIYSVFTLPNLVDTYQGQLVGLGDNSITVDTTQGRRSFDISQADFQGVTYGSLEAGNAVTVATSKSDLIPGKSVFVVAEKFSSQAKSVYISR